MMRRLPALADVAMIASGICLLSVIVCWTTLHPHLLPGGWFLVAAVVLCACGIWHDPTETEEQRQYRHAQRKPDRVDRLIAEHEADMRGWFAHAALHPAPAEWDAAMDAGQPWPEAEDFRLWEAGR